MAARDHEYVAIGLPLPVSMVAALGDLFERAWPGTTIITDPEGAGVPAHLRYGGPRDRMLLKVPARAPKRVSKANARAIAEEHARPEDDPDLDLASIAADGTMSLSAPEQLLHALAPIAEAVLTDSDAANYVEMPVRHPDHDGTLLITVARSTGQTPHELRQAAVRERDEAREVLRAVWACAVGAGVDDDALRARCARALGE